MTAAQGIPLLLVGMALMLAGRFGGPPRWRQYGAFFVGLALLLAVVVAIALRHAAS